MQESFVDQIIENVFEQKQLKSTCKEVQEQQQTIGEQAKSLKAQEERLESQQTKIEIIREMLEEDKGNQANNSIFRRVDFLTTNPRPDFFLNESV